MLQTPFDPLLALPASADTAKGRDGNRGIADLMPSCKLGQGQIEQPIPVLIDQPPALLEGVEIFAIDGDRNAELIGAAHDDRFGVFVLGTNDRRRAAL